MEPLLSGIVSVLIFIVIDGMLRKKFPQQGIVEVCRETLGSFGACLISIAFALFFAILTASVMRQFTENVITTVLPNTPILVVGAAFMVAVVYVAYCGLEGVARVAYMAMPVLVVGILALCLMTWNWWEPTLLFPFWGNGLVHIIWGAGYTTSIFVNVVLLCMVRGHAHNPRDVRKAGITSIVLSTVVLTVFLLAYHMVFAPDEASKLTAPMYSLARSIYFGRFVQRLESVFIFMWVSAAVVKMAVTTWAAAYFLGACFGWPTYRPAIPAIGLFCWSLSMVPSDVAVVYRVDEQVLWRWGWIFTLLLPMLIAIVGILRKPRRRPAEHA